MEEASLRQLAAQLRQPSGEPGRLTGEWMNRGNVQMNSDTIKVLAATAGDNILEVGMGNGFFVQEIVQQDTGIQYTGADFSEVMIAEASRINSAWINNGQVNFVLADVAALPFADAAFNKIFTINTIYFWNDPVKILAELKRVLQPKGTLIITLRPRRHMQNYPFVKYGFTMYSREEAESLLTQQGFTIAQTLENREPDFDLNGQTVPMENLVIEAVKE
jgi:ubiquinone/menaquinone biosynthesis C-methylase UbiE